MVKPSDITMNDLYGEQISAYVSGNSSILKHSIFTNDTNIIPNLDTLDPAFLECDIFISSSNGIVPGIFPYPVSTGNIEERFGMTFNSYAGFLHYNEDLTSEEAIERSERAFEIIRRKFEIDIIMVNSSYPNFFPFVGYYPDWSLFLEELTQNIPKDGYWKALDIERLKSNEYIENKHLSLSFALINSPHFFREDLKHIEIDQIDFNTGVILSSFIEGLETEGIFEQLETTFQENEDLINNIAPFLGLNQSFTFEDSLEFNNSIFNFSLTENSHYTIIEIQYEGREEGIYKVDEDQYVFDLFSSLGYNEPFLEPSEKVFINFIGSFFTQLDINILSTEIIRTTPKFSKFNANLIDQISFLLYLADVDIDLQTLENYSFQLLWRELGGIKHNFVNIINLENENDVVNFLPALGFTGIPSFPSGLLEPLDDFQVEFKVANSESNLRIISELLDNNASYGSFKEFNFNISIKNVGNDIVYGIPTPIPVGLEEMIQIMLFLEGGNINYADELLEDIELVVDTEYPNQYKSLEEFFNFNKDPRIFYVDSYGDGAYDYYYPDPFNITNLYPYNSKMDEIIDILWSEFPNLFIDLAMTPNELKDAFLNRFSVWNENNWKLNPGEVFSYLIENYSISDLDSFQEFFAFNFSIREDSNPLERLPLLIYGNQLESTTSYDALIQDNESWVIFSEEYFDQNRIEIQFLAQNNSIINFKNNTIDKVSLVFNLSIYSDTSQFQIFDFKEEAFINLQPYLETTENSTFIYSIAQYNDSINWLFKDPLEGDYRLIFQLIGEANEEFNVTIDNIDIKFLTREINPSEIKSEIIYSSNSGNVRYSMHSNSIVLSTDKMASLMIISNLSKYNLPNGEVNTYNMIINNIGSEVAYNITISLKLPGIIEDSGNFSVKENKLQYTCRKLTPSEKISIYFSFFAPNSEKIENIEVLYNNSEPLEQGDSNLLISHPNNVFFSSPVDYYERTPFVHLIELNLNSSNSKPDIYQIFNLSLGIKNVGQENHSIESLNISNDDQFGDLLKIISYQSGINNLDFNKEKTLLFSFNKTEWKGYYYPALNFINSKESEIIQIKKSDPIVLGEIEILIVKSVNKNEIEIGEEISIQFSVKNTGTICIKNIKLNDVIGFSELIFSLQNGNLIYEIQCLKPNETKYYNYTIVSKVQSKTTLEKASISYYFLHETISYSNKVDIKVILPKNQQILYVIIPSVLGIGILITFIWYSKRHKKKIMEYQRNEIKIMNLESRDSILHVKSTLKEYLKEINKGDLDDT